MFPFLHNEVFKVSEKLKTNLIWIGHAPVLVVDNFFENFDAIQEIVGSTPAGNWKYTEEGRNFLDYYDCRISFPALQTEMFVRTQSLIKEYFKLDTYHLGETINVNWFKQIEPRRADFAFPHSDKTVTNSQFTCLVYLNSPEESFGGTAFFDKKNQNAPYENGDDYWPNMEDWEMLDYARMAPNRLIIFPAEFYHAAFHPVDVYDWPRTTLVYWMAR